MAYPQHQGVPVMTQPAQPQLMRLNPQSTAIRPGLAHHSQNRLGILQIVCGMLLSAVAVVMIFFHSSLYFFGYGIWTGLIFITAGALGVSSAKSKNTCPIVGCLIMSIFSMMAAAVVLSFGAIGLGIDSSRTIRCRDYEEFGSSSGFRCEGDRTTEQVNIALQTINVLTGLFEFIVALVQMIICCRALCCAPSQPGTVYYAAAPQQIQVQGQYPQHQQPTYPQYQPQQYGQPQGPYPQGGYPHAGYSEHHGMQQYGGAHYQPPQQGAPPMYPQLQQPYDDPGRPPPYNPSTAFAPAYSDASYPVKQ